MATLVGVGEECLDVSAIDLLGRLRFRGNEVTLVHVAPSLGESVSEAKRATGSDATVFLLKAAVEAAESGMGRPRLIHATPSSLEAFLRLANHGKADLVVLAAQEHGWVASLSPAVIGHMLAVDGRRSFLIGRGRRKGASSIMAVFATDHSVYANRCFERLLDMDPQGLAYVWIVSAREPGCHPERRMTKGPPDPSVQAACERERLKRRNGQEMASRLQSKGIEAEFRFVDGHPADVLRGVMDRTQADLMILGALGDGPAERSAVGSVALHAVVTDSYPVLVLRNDGEG